MEMYTEEFDKAENGIAKSFLNENLQQHIRYVTQDDLKVGFANPGKVIKITIEWADESETHPEKENAT